VTGGDRGAQASLKPIKRSVSIAGHRTSLSLEPEFWDALQRAAAEDSTSLAGLIALIDARRGPRNLSSAVRVWLLERADRGIVSSE
jgi:predicted DNA-binding ribbon-helix-helix protein